MSNGRVGLMVGRFQPLHRGHLKSINRMIQDCETAIICLGSAQRSREEHDPWTVEERQEMLKNVYGDRIKIKALNDLGAVGPKEWTDYILSSLKKIDMKEPTDYYTGSKFDSSWYNHTFYLEGVSVIDGNHSYITADLQRRKLHLIDRDMNPVPAATELRGFLQLRSDGWKEWVPAVNHELVEGTYPEEFKIPLK